MSVLTGFHGVEVNEDLDKKIINREYRPASMRFMDAARDSGGHVMIGFSILPITMPIFAEIWLFVGLILYLLLLKRPSIYPIEAPIKRVKTFGGGTKLINKGMFPVGYEANTDRRIFLSDDQVRTHFLVCGTTGSGKTVFLLALLYCGTLLGSGAIFVDGKADIKSFWLIYDTLMRLGRVHDLLLLSYLTGGKEATALSNARNRLSNTNNILGSGSTEELTEIIVGCMAEAGGDSAMWKGRAKILVATLMRSLVELRNKGLLSLDVREFTKYMPLPRIMELSRDPRLSEANRAGLKTYLIDLPGMTMDAINSGSSASEKANEQNQYLQMQLTECLTELSQTYGHIFNTKVGEINFNDVVYNRRILYVMLPALAKSPSSLASLGKLVIAQIKSALTPALGDQVEGFRDELLDSRPSDATVPFLLVLDEYGYYATRGFSAVAAQARSLGIWVVYACQDLPSLQMDEGAKIEYRSILGNTNFKVFMKIEEEETHKFVIERGFKAHVSRTQGSSARKDSLVGGYRDRGEAGIQEIDRVSARDLYMQKNGMCHFFYGEKMIRGRTLFIELPPTKEAQLVQLLPVSGPDPTVVQQVKNLHKHFEHLVKTGLPLGHQSTGQDVNVGAVSRTQASSMAEDYNLAIDKGYSPLQASICVVGGLSLRVRSTEKAMTPAVSAGASVADLQAAAKRNSAPQPKADRGTSDPFDPFAAKQSHKQPSSAPADHKDSANVTTFARMMRSTSTINLEEGFKPAAADSDGASQALRPKADEVSAGGSHQSSSQWPEVRDESAGENSLQAEQYPAVNDEHGVTGSVDTRAAAIVSEAASIAGITPADYESAKASAAARLSPLNRYPEGDMPQRPSAESILAEYEMFMKALEEASVVGDDEDY